jgi:hypothetical protein
MALPSTVERVKEEWKAGSKRMTIYKDSQRSEKRGDDFPFTIPGREF